ncbi:alpha-L-rhamnosidase [Subtercola endophyticus]|uniref:alpha-L-rhamnosidase n=1 Tax=Subtercola endophyticus TaxID=2895559 RepID=UPI001E4CE9D4|nr:alpha-L-rhamnosidase [Subtercola endophyticus]UFS58564.1 glycoside hydrolase family 78 protein [Subtercola endophyticus]
MTVTVAAPTFEHHNSASRNSALGIGEPEPRLSWKITGEAGWVQSAYEISVERGGETVSTGRVESAESVLVRWPAAAGPLVSRQRAAVRVRVWGGGSGAEFGHGTPADPENADAREHVGEGGNTALRAAEAVASEWSAPGVVEAGLLQPSDWTALAVGPAWPEDPDADRRPPLVRREFVLDDDIASARLYVTAHGLYEVEINGTRVGDDALSPGWTVYGERLRYYTYDVTSQLEAGANAIGSWLADGWYRGRYGFNGGHRNLYGTDIALVAQLEVTYADGSMQSIVTDGSWQAGFGPMLATELYNGETYDARISVAGWSRAGFDASEFSPVAVAPHDASVLVAPQGPPVRCTEELSPVTTTTKRGATILDFGQNFSGRLRIRVKGSRGDVITLRHAEVLQNGELYRRPLRGAAAEDTYILSGEGEEVWEPRFTIHGFRYAEVTGWPGELAAGDIVARVYHTDMQRTGWFESSDPLVDRLHENVVWSTRSNFVDIPTDCPQRDERLGWTGDIQVFAPTASFLYDCSGMLSSWLRDVAAEQLEDGTVPWYVPVIPGGEMWTPIRPGAVWGDVAVLTPWVLYERFGDEGVLAAQYDSAKKWVDLVDRLAGPSHLWNSGSQLGDWLDPAAPPHDPADALTDRYLVATAYFAWSALHLAKSAEVLGLTSDATHYFALAAQVRAAFAAEYVLADGRLTSDAQTAYSLAIEFDLLPSETQLAGAGARLSELVAAAGNRIATGFAGTPVVSDALTDTGNVSRAYDLLLEQDCPSWLYTVVNGATTIWERWDSQLADGTVNPGEMTSFNHYALGAVADWLHRVVAGLAPAAPGYRSISFRPRPGGGLTRASARHETPYGEASISWSLAAGTLSVDVTVPIGATATVDLPDGRLLHVGPGIHSFTAAL